MKGMINNNRRTVLKKLASGIAGCGLVMVVPNIITSCASKKSGEEESGTAKNGLTEPADLFFKISLAQWSLHKTLFEGKLKNLDFPATAKNEFGIDAVEYVNQFFKDKANDQQYLQELKQRSEDVGVENVLIMVDGEGHLGNLLEEERNKAVENHYKWIEAAKFLGCHAIRVNAAGDGTAEEVMKAAVDGLGKLSEFGAKHNISVIVENHGGYSSNGEWLSTVIGQVHMDNCGTLPDFGNFCIKQEGSECINAYDRYKGVKELMPYAKGVSAKSHNFNEEGQETNTDYSKMLQLVKDAGYDGHIGIEYEGSELSEYEGIKATKNLLLSVGRKIS